MKYLYMELLPNLFYILTTLLVFQFFLIKKQILNYEGKPFKILIFLFAFISIFLCITFPVKITENYFYDLREIPFIVGGLYGGPLAALGLFLLTVGYRFLFGGLGIGITIITLSFLSVFSAILSKQFIKMRIRNKLFTACSLVLLYSFVLLLSCQYVYELPDAWISVFIPIVLAELIAMGIIIYLVEAICNTNYLRNRIAYSEKLEIVSHLAASISHEVRNPLTTTNGFLQLLREQETDLKKTQYINLALDELSRAEGIVRDYLTYAKPAPEKLELLDLQKQIGKTVAIIQPLANMNSVEIELNLFQALVKGEEAQLQQCLLNIVKNAIESMPSGGKLSIRMKKQNTHALLTISDKGCGMTKEQIARLGEPYFTTKDQKGTGLGMMVVFRVVEAMKGKIKVDSEVGKGTIFTIEFPFV
jgi:two-component system, sporulation sensor kinase B